MNMIGHQYIGVYITLTFTGIFIKPVKVASIILICEKADLAVVTPLNKMQGHAGKG